VPPQQATLLPSWSVEPGPGSPWSSADAYTPNCEADEDPLHENRLRWITVEVLYRGEDRPVVCMTTAIIRSAYR
jgi:hypothetical protein